MNAFELCTKRSPRRLGVHAWEKFLTVEEFQELSSARDAVEQAEIRLEEFFSETLVQVKIRWHFRCFVFPLIDNYR
jgi:hypothetical protein